MAQKIKLASIASRTRASAVVLRPRVVSLGGFLLGSSILLPTGGWAQTAWTGTNSSDWFASGNWSTAAVPDASTSVVVNNPNANTPVINAAGAAASTLSLGVAAGQTGTLTIDGGSLTTAAAPDPSLVIGDQGTGLLTIKNGGTLTSGSSYSAFDPGGTGTVDVTEVGSKWAPANLYIGADANTNGLVTVENGATLAVTGNTELAINSATAGGTLTITGPGSIFTTGGVLWVGTSGSGTMNVDNGATATVSGGTAVSVFPGVSGVLSVDGTGSLMQTQGGLFVGQNGTVNITDGGKIDSTVGSASFNGDGEVHVDGTGSLWQTGSLLLTNSGGGGLLVSGGGKATSTSGNVTGSATITDAQSQWTIGGGLTVNGGSISVLAGGALSSNSGQIGNGSNGGSVTVSGTDASSNASTWTVGNLTIAPTGASGTLGVKAGGKVSALTLTSNANAMITVDGASSVLNVLGGANFSANLSSSNTGTTSVMVSKGGAVVVGNQWTLGTPTDFISSDIGANVGSTVNVTVTGVGSSWSNPIGGMAVGDAGSASLTIADGGQVSTGFLGIGRGAASDSVVTVTGAGSLLTLTDGSHGFEVGSLGKGTLKVLSGGEVKTGGGGLTMGAFGGGQGEVLVDGAGSLLMTKALSLGPFNPGKLTVSNGGRVEATGVSTGENPGIDGAQIIVDGGALIANAGGTADFGDLAVGTNASASLIAKNGSTLTANGVIIAEFANSTGVMTLSGTDTTLTLSGNRQLIVGAGSGVPSPTTATMTVDTGAKVMADGAVWIASGTMVTGTLNVRDAGSSVSAAKLSVGGGNSAGGTGSLVIADGASVAIGGAATIFAHGRLQIGEGAAPGSFTATSLADNGVLDFDHTGNLTFSTPISGSGSIEHDGTGTTVFRGTSTFNGMATVDAGTLQMGDTVAGSMSSATFVVNAGGTLGGTGSIGSTTINDGGTLAGAQGHTLTTGDLTLASGSNVNVSLGAPGNATGLFSVSGNLTLDGTLNVTNAGGFGQGLYRIIDYTGTLTDNGMSVGALPIGHDGTIQTAVAHQVNLVVDGGGNPGGGGPFVFWDGTNTAANGVVDGGSGTWNATSTNWTNTAADGNGTYDTSALLIFTGAAGTVNVDAGGGSLALGSGIQFAKDGFVVQGDNLALTAGDTAFRVGDGTQAGAAYIATIAANLTGAGGLDKTDLGTLVLTGTNSYGGGTTISAGTLRGSSTSFGAGAIQDDATLIVDQTTDASFANAINGAGKFTKTGMGSLDLAGTGTFSGATTVEAGALAVNGSLANSIVTVASGARIGGNGTVGGLLLGSGATVAPGNSIGTLNVAGNITFNAGSIYAVEVNAAGQSDKIAATGTATINGGRVDVLAGSGNYAPATTYTILTANDGRTGMFTDGVTSNLAFLDPSLSYDASHVYLTMTRNDISFCVANSTRNQCATGNGVESLNIGNPIWDAAVQLDAGTAANAFDRLSGEIYASAKTAILEDSRFIRDAVGDRLHAAFGGGSASNAATTDGPAVWGQGFGSWGHWNGDGNAAHLHRSIGGFFVGADTPVFGNWRFGAVAGYSRTTFDAKGRSSSGASNNYSTGVYGGSTWDDFAVRGGAAYTWHSISTSRSVIFPGFEDSLTADYNAGTAQVFGEFGYDLRPGNVTLEPFANLAYVNLHTGRLTEKGDATALHSASATTDATFTTLGLRGSTNFDLDGVVLTAKGMLGWRYAFSDVTPLATMRFVSGGDAFTIAGVPIAQDTAVIEGGFDVSLSSTATLGVSYGNQFRSGFSDQTVHASFNVKL